jgi:cytochrome oxidase assembly protein ShyY1
VYRFLATPRWIGFAVLMIAMSIVMVGLSDWQLHRYHTRHGINVQISTDKVAKPVPLTSLLNVDHPVASDKEWTRVTVSGTYAPDKTVIARERTVGSSVGFEIVTPLVLADGSAVLIDRGFVASDDGTSKTLPTVPPVPTGIVTVTGRVHSAESEADPPLRVDGQLTFRRIAPDSVKTDLGYQRLYPDYVLLDAQSPKAVGSFTKIPADTQPAWMNAGYTVQWAGFALIPIFGFIWQARKEAHDRRDGVVPTPKGPKQPRSRDRVPALVGAESSAPAEEVPAAAISRDRVAAADAAAATRDRVAAADKRDRVASADERDRVAAADRRDRVAAGDGAGSP